MANFASLVGSQDYSGAVKLLDTEISDARHSYEDAMHRLVQLHLNRGICNQKLQLNRMALKVGPLLIRTQAGKVGKQQMQP